MLVPNLLIVSIGSALNLYSSGSLTDFIFAIGYLLFAISMWRYAELTRKDNIADEISKFGKIPSQ